MDSNGLPLSGIRVLELSHAVMGPTCGLILADMGAEVIKVERAPKGDDTRRLLGFGLGLFPFFNRNKKSLVVDLKSEAGTEVLRRLIAESDVFLENFGPGAVDRLGFSYEACAEINPRLIYCSLKGFMPGPYENRPSLDNLVQMMGGLAYMTGPTGRPLRAGTSVIDIMGGSYGALGIITALYERERTGRGQKVLSTLYEATAFLVGQHMAVAAVTGTRPEPMPDGVNPWAVYDLFKTSEGDLVFIGLTSDFHWQRFCGAFELNELVTDERFSTNNERVRHRAVLLPELTAVLGGMSKEEIVARCEEASIPFAPVVSPDELSADIHLNESGALVDVELPDGKKAKLPKLPLRMGDYDFSLRNSPPPVGRGGGEVLETAGYTKNQIQKLAAAGTVVLD